MVYIYVHLLAIPIMGADGHVYIFFTPKAWVLDFVTTICRTTIPDDVIDYVPYWQPILTFEEHNPNGCYAYWDTENYDVVANDDLSCLDADTMKSLREEYQTVFNEQLDIAVPISTWLHEFLDDLCDMNDEIWT